MFKNCTSLASIDLSSFETENVIDISQTFYHCSLIKTLNLSNFNTKKLELAYSLFEGCKSLTSIDLSSWVNTNIYNMAKIFKNCPSLKHINISSFKWNDLIENYLSNYPDTLLDFLPKSAELIMNKDFYLHLINITNKTDLNITII